MNRARVAQSKPLKSKDYTSFPSETRARQSQRWRAHAADKGVWYFSSDGGGRFDLAPPQGTCYIADTIEVAVRERLGKRILKSRTIDPDTASSFSVTQITLPRGRFADVSAESASDYGVTREISTMTPYATPQAWAAMFSASGFDGVKYQARFSTGPRPDAWALFGEAGPASGKTGAIVTGEDACRIAKVAVTPVPFRSRSVTVTKPPSS